MNECQNCGGAMITKGGGIYKCRFCGNVWKDPSFVPLKAQAPQAPREQQTRTQTVSAQRGGGSYVYEKNINGILEIVCSYPNCSSAGSGFLISGGYAITNAHVVTNNYIPCKNIQVTVAGETVGASIFALGDDRGGEGNGDDLAILRLDRVPTGAKYVELADFSSVRIGESVYVIGNSLGHGTCITGGIVSDDLREVDGHMLLMTDCAVNGGNSGGPIFNEQGLAIGAIVSKMTNVEGMNFAIPSNTVMRFLRKNNIIPGGARSSW